MTAIDFPNSPGVGQVFTSGDKTWGWTGTRWEIVVVTGTGLVIPSVELSSDITLEPQTKYFVNTSAARTLTLPATPTIGDEILLVDASENAAVNNVSVLNNTNKINGVLDSVDMDVNAFVASFLYTGTAYGWRMI